MVFTVPRVLQRESVMSVSSRKRLLCETERGRVLHGLTTAGGWREGGSSLKWPFKVRQGEMGWELGMGWGMGCVGLCILADGGSVGRGRWAGTNTMA